MVDYNKKGGKDNTSIEISPNQWANLLLLAVEWINITLPTPVSSFSFYVAREKDGNACFLIELQFSIDPSVLNYF